MYDRVDLFTIIKWFFKMLVVSLVIFVVGEFLWRFWVSRVPKELKVITPNETLYQAYSEKGEALTLMVQEQTSTTQSESAYGYFTVCQAVFIPDAQQLQLLVRYNHSTPEATERDYGLAEGTLDPLAECYDFSLLLMLDKTPDNTEDNLIKDLDKHRDAIELVRVRPTEVAAATHEKLHSYRRLIFDGITVDDTLLAVFADFYWLGDISYLAEDFDPYTAKGYATLCVYAFTEERVTTSLSKEDIQALEAYGN